MERPLRFCRTGQYGGDALAVARMMAEKGYKVEVFLFNTKGELSPDCQANKELVEIMDEITFHEVSTQFAPPALTEDHLVIDGLFGSGLNKPLSGGFAAVVKYINASPATVVAIDIPSGLMGEENTFNIRANIIKADVTLSLQLPKLAFLFAENAEFLGDGNCSDIHLSEEESKNWIPIMKCWKWKKYVPSSIPERNLPTKATSDMHY